MEKYIPVILTLTKEAGKMFHYIRRFIHKLKLHMLIAKKVLHLLLIYFVIKTGYSPFGLYKN